MIPEGPLNKMVPPPGVGTGVHGDPDGTKPLPEPMLT